MQRMKCRCEEVLVLVNGAEASDEEEWEGVLSARLEGEGEMMAAVRDGRWLMVDGRYGTMAMAYWR